MCRPLLVYDGECTVCCRQLENLRFLLGDRFDATSFRDDDLFRKHPNLSREACEQAVQLLMPKGKIYAGAEAVARTMALRKLYYPAMLLYYVPGLRRMWDAFYRSIARNRNRYQNERT